MGIDFDLLIPSLLLLHKYSISWKEGVLGTTQLILNAVCNIAGRPTSDVPLYFFDSITLMKQCAKMNNVMAAANLIGGHDGLVLKCAHILIEITGFNMQQAQQWVTHDIGRNVINVPNIQKLSFEINDGHKNLLWLLEKHVLTVTKYGDFVTSQSRGKIDPIFAARTCLRTWNCLIGCGYQRSCQWLENWLVQKLHLDSDDNKLVNKMILACASFTQALLWPENEVKADGTVNSLVLAESMGFSINFLIKMCQKCCGVMEVIPPL